MKFWYFTKLKWSSCEELKAELDILVRICIGWDKIRKVYKKFIEIDVFHKNGYIGVNLNENIKYWWNLTLIRGVSPLQGIGEGWRGDRRELYGTTSPPLSLSFHKVCLAEWLRRLTRNQLGFPAQVRVLQQTSFFVKPFYISIFHFSSKCQNSCFSLFFWIISVDRGIGYKIVIEWSV